MNRLYAVDILRAFCILAVMGHHFYDPSVQTYGPSNPLLRALGPVFRNGQWGVTGFFVVSGFLITRLLLREERGFLMPLRDFYARRAARLLPLLVLVLLLGGVILSTHRGDPILLSPFYGGRPGQFTMGFWASIVGFVYNWYYVFSPGAGFNGLHWNVLWSLAVEEQFYLFYPLLIRARTSESWRCFWLGGVILSGVVFHVWAFARKEPLVAYTFMTPGAFDALGIGACAYLFWRRARQTLEARPAAAAALSLMGSVIILWTFWNYQKRPLEMVVAPTLLSLGCALFLIGACSLPRSLGPWLRVGAFVGSLSYGLYLLHVTVFYFLRPVLPHLGSYDRGVAFYFSMSIAVAWLSHRFYEVPANRWVRDKLRVGKWAFKTEKS